MSDLEREETEEEFQARLKAEILQVHLKEVPPPTGISIFRLNLQDGDCSRISAVLTEEELQERAAKERLDPASTSHEGFNIINPSPFTSQVEVREELIRQNAEWEKIADGVVKIRQEILTWPEDIRSRILNAGMRLSGDYSKASFRDRMWWNIQDSFRSIKRRVRRYKSF